MANSKLGYSNFTHLEPWEPLTHSNGEWDPRSAKDTFTRITVFRSNKFLTSKRPTSFFYFIFIYLLNNFIIIIFYINIFFSNYQESILLAWTLIIIVPFSFWIFTFVSNFQLQLDHTIWIVTTLRFFIRTSKEGRLVSPKYRETQGRFCLYIFVIKVISPRIL